MSRLFILNALIIMCLGAVICGCQTRKLPAGDVEIMQKYRTEIAILHDPKIKANTEIKYNAAKIILDNVDFSYARNYKDLEQIFGFTDVDTKILYGGQKALVFKYSWENKVIEATFHFSGYSITGVKIKDLDNASSQPTKIKSYNRLKPVATGKVEVTNAK